MAEQTFSSTFSKVVASKNWEPKRFLRRTSSRDTASTTSLSSLDNSDHHDNLFKNLSHQRRLSCTGGGAGGCGGGGGRGGDAIHVPLVNVMIPTRDALRRTASNSSLRLLRSDSMSFASSQDGEDSITMAGSTKSSTNSILRDFLANMTEIASDLDEASDYDEEEDEDVDEDDVSVLTGFSSYNSERIVRASSGHDCHALPTKKSSVKTSKRNPSRSASCVSFGSINIRYYERILTDNPSCADGRAIGIGWNIQDVKDYPTVDAWENATQEKRPAKKLHLGKKARERILAMQGYSSKDIQQMARDIYKIRHQRRATIAALGSQEVEELVEMARHKVKRFLFSKNTPDINVHQIVC
jgi:hypothetical protein